MEGGGQEIRGGTDGARRTQRKDEGWRRMNAKQSTHIFRRVLSLSALLLRHCLLGWLGWGVWEGGGRMGGAVEWGGGDGVPRNTEQP